MRFSKLDRRRHVLAIPRPHTRRPLARTLGRVGLVLCLAIATVSCGSASGPSDERPDLILLTVDTTRADRIGSYGHSLARTPNLDRLSRRGLRIDHAISTVPLTLPSHASILTGTLPAYHGVHDNGFEILSDEGIETLAEVLGDAGYGTNAVIGAFVLDRRFGLDQGFDEYEDDPRELYHANTFHGARDAASVTDTALEILAGARRNAPLFLWAHYFDPHAPFEAPEPFGSLVDAPGDLGAYDAEVAYMDAQIGRLLAGIESARGSRERLVVVVGDHGEGLRTPHAEESHGMFLYDEAIRVPLILADTAGRVPSGTVAAEAVSLIDVAPSMLAYAGVEAPASMVGRSLLTASNPDTLERDADPEGASRLAAISETRMPLHYYGWSPLHTLRTERWKLVLAPNPELYDLWADPSESTNLAARESEQADVLESRLRQELAAAETARGKAGASDSVSLSDADRRKLTALGYLTPDRQTGASDGAALLTTGRDPKDLYSVHERISAAAADRAEGRTDRAIALLEAALAEDPENTYGLRILGQCLDSIGEHAEALTKYERAAEQSPGYELLYDIGTCHERIAEAALRRGDRTAANQAFTSAKQSYRRCLEVFPADHFSMTRIGIASARGRNDGGEEARTWFRRAIESAPRYPEAYYSLAQLLLSRNLPSDARGVLKEAEAALGGPTPDTDYLTGECHRVLGQKKKAIARYRSAAAHNDNARRRLAELEGR